MDELCETGVIPPPEEPELPATLGVVSPPHAQHIGCQASAKTVQNWVLLSKREKDGRGGRSLPHKASPLYSSQIRLWEKKGGKKSEFYETVLKGLKQSDNRAALLLICCCK